MDFDPCLFGMSKDDVGRCMSKDSYYACNTESECNILSLDPLGLQRYTGAPVNRDIFCHDTNIDI